MLIILDILIKIGTKKSLKDKHFMKIDKRLTQIFTLFLCAILSSCIPLNEESNSITININVDGEQRAVQVPGDTTVQSAIDLAGITLTNLDRTEPPSYMLLRDSETITITRVEEAFEIEENIIPFERQTVRNESLPEGQTLLIQPGINGIQQITYRTVYEDGIEKTKTIFKASTLQEPKHEIIMVGVQAPFSAVTISGSIVYLTAGNAWIMDGSTGNRKPLITTGDLDGHIFSLSSDGEMLLFSRLPENPDSDELNHLWAVDITEKLPEPIDMRISNVVHFAEWYPGSSSKILYSTVEPRSTAPGWQANNDLLSQAVNSSGVIIEQEEIIEANSGGVYGWWGINYHWSDNGQWLAYARPDSIGLVDFEERTLLPLLDINPFQTNSEWAWVPSIGWSHEHNIIYTITHADNPGDSTNEGAPYFDLQAIIPEEELVLNIQPQVGMFAYPAPSYSYNNDQRYSIAYLQSIFPEQSNSSRYRLMIIDRDGSNKRLVFPPEDSQGLNPQQVVWSPNDGEDSNWLALVYEGNLWLVDPLTNNNKQITGDGSITKIAWK